MILGLLAKSGMQITIPPIFIMIVLALLLAVWLVFTLIIRYHWKNYGTGGASIFKMNFFYLTGSAIFIIVLLLFGLLYIASSLA